MKPNLVDCPKCNGAGTIPHEKRKLVDGTVDPTDLFKVFDLCEPCGGSGKVPLNPASVQQ